MPLVVDVIQLRNIESMEEIATLISHSNFYGFS